MTLNLLRNSSEHVARVGVVVGLALVGFIAYAVPFYGFLASLCLPFMTHACRRHLWPESSTIYSSVWPLLVWLGLWLPGLVDFFTPAFYAAGVEVSISWLIIPLCAPSDASAVLVPSLVAGATCLVGLLGTVATRRAWPWVAAAWLAPWVHYLAFSQIQHEFVC